MSLRRNSTLFLTRFNHRIFTIIGNSYRELSYYRPTQEIFVIIDRNPKTAQIKSAKSLERFYQLNFGKQGIAFFCSEIKLHIITVFILDEFNSGAPDPQNMETKKS